MLQNKKKIKKIFCILMKTLNCNKISNDDSTSGSNQSISSLQSNYLLSSKNNNNCKTLNFIDQDLRSIEANINSYLEKEGI